MPAARLIVEGLGMLILLGLRKSITGPHEIVGIFTGAGFGLQRAKAKTYRHLDSARRTARTLTKGLRPSDEVTKVICADERNLGWTGRPKVLVVTGSPR